MTDPNDDMRNALFEPAGFEPAGGQRYVPTEYSRGPWDPAHCHGGPVAALLARAVEQCEPGEVDWHVARLTIELIRPVPVGRPLTLTTQLERPGRRVSLVAGYLVDGDTEVARVRGLRIRRDPLDVPPVAADPAGGEFPAGPDDSRAESFRLTTDDPDAVSFARSASEHRFAAGSWLEPGPVAVWIRLTVPVLPDEVPTGIQRVAAATDFGNGVSSVLPWDDFLFINPDLTVHLVRPADGEWIGLLASTSISTHGGGLAQSAVHDATGPVGRSLQSLYVAPR